MLSGGQRKRCPVGGISIFDVDATEIMPGLFQGGLGRNAGCRLAFRDLDMAVVLCSTDVLDDGRKVEVIAPPPLRLGLLDSKRDLSRLPEIRRIVSKIVAKLKRNQRVGVFCWEGRNRSGLVTALTLRRVHGISGQEAVDWIRSLRHNALCTESGAFEKYLASLGPLWT